MYSCMILKIGVVLSCSMNDILELKNNQNEERDTVL